MEVTLLLTVLIMEVSTVLLVVNGKNIRQKIATRQHALDNLTFSENVLFELTTRAQTQCSLECLERERCSAFTFMRPSLTCRGHWLGPAVGSHSSSSPDTVTWIYTKTALVGTWTVIQRRQDGSVDFYRPWSEYANGFGNYPDGEFWIGLETLHTLTSSGNWTLRFELEDWLGGKRYASYTGFYITNSTTNYRLMYTLGSYSGDAGDGLAYHRGYAFSTFDADNDPVTYNCAVNCRGAWWFNACHNSDLNGQYYYNDSVSFGQGVSWYYWKGFYYSLKFAEMKIRRA